MASSTPSLCLGKRGAPSAPEVAPLPWSGGGGGGRGRAFVALVAL